MKLISACRMCESGNLRQFLDLGSTPPADRFLLKRQLAEPEPSYPLQVLLCQDCGLAQLTAVVPAETLYCHDYPYESSTTRAGREHWKEFAETTAAMTSLGGDDLVVDVGSNVGVLLGMFRDEGARILGVDPAANIAEIARGNGVETVTGFFDSAMARRVRSEYGPARVITATNVFAHIDDLSDFAQAVDHLLAERGVLVIEMPYFGELLRNTEYDTIYHEHLSYVSLKPVHRFFQRFDLEVFDVLRRDMHGGSFRVFVQRKGRTGLPVAPSVGIMLEEEVRDAIHEWETVERFVAAVAENRRSLRTLLTDLKRSGKRIAAVSAPAKGMTLLNYCGIGTEFLDCVTEKSRLKIGRFTPGTHLRVEPDDWLRRERPDYALLLAWNFSAEIMRNLKEYAALGGKFIIPIPIPRVVGEGA